MLNESALDSGKVEYEDKEHKTIEKWEADEIIKQVGDTNLGDFMIKCPNPDNLPDDWKEKYKVEEKEGGQKSKYQKINVSQALEFYYDLFDL